MDTEKFNLLKSHIDQYTRSDGTVVQAHDDKRVAAKPKPAAAPSLGANAKALAASSKPGDLDHEDNQIAAGYMKDGDHEGLATHLKHRDTAARDHILDHIHPDHWDGLGFKPLDHAKSAKEYDAKFGPKTAAPGPSGGTAGSKAPSKDIPDEEKPEHSLAGLSSKTLGKVASGAINIKDHAHHELASRGLDSDGEWAGFALSKVHHEGSMTNHGEGFKPHTELAEHLQTVHKNVLSGAAKGKVDLQSVAKQTLAARGHDSSGNWIGFDAAKKHHGVK